jgi:hypothetical protein
MYTSPAVQPAATDTQVSKHITALMEEVVSVQVRVQQVLFWLDKNSWASWSQQARTTDFLPVICPLDSKQ